MPKRKKIDGSSSWVTIYFDGGAEPNPGPASGAAILDIPNGESVTVTVDLGIATNNVAEYSGCVAGLKKAGSIDFAMLPTMLNHEISGLSGFWTAAKMFVVNISIWNPIEPKGIETRF